MKGNSSKMKSLMLCSLVMIIVVGCSPTNRSSSNKQYPETNLGWKLGSGSYGFKYFTFFEAVDKIDSCNLKYVEGFPGHQIGGGLEGKLDYRMDALTRELILEKLKEKGLRLVAYGVITPKSEAEWRQLFEFGKAMGIETFTSEPEEKDLPLISRLCDEYQINVAIHNHAYPSRYWSPENVLAAIKGQSNRVGACADIGHWIRSGLDPVESLKKLEGHVLHLHMKDMNEKNKEAHNVHWGSGVANTDGIINELKRQRFKGMISAEYEHNWHNNVPDIKASIAYFRNAIQ